MAKKNDKKKAIENLREKIDTIDEKLLEMLQKRVSFSAQIAFLKNAIDTPIYNPERERDIIKSIIEKNKKFFQKKSRLQPEVILRDNSLHSIFSEIVSACRQSVVATRAGFLGPEGSFSHLAALQLFGSTASLKAHSTIAEVFNAVSRGDESLAVVPIENSFEGIVTQSIDRLASDPVHIIYECYLPIHLTLLSRERDLKNIEKIYSHPQALAQSSIWINKNLPNAELIETSSTSQAAYQSTITKKSGSIGHRRLAALYPTLSIKKNRIENSKANVTRFVVISPRPFFSSGKEDITTVIISIKDKPGALLEVLKLFASSKINLTNLVSRPSKRKAFDYIFFIDFVGNVRDKKVKNTLDKIEKIVMNTKILGSYPKGISLDS